jgi:ribosomal protein S27AE
MDTTWVELTGVLSVNKICLKCGAMLNSAHGVCYHCGNDEFGEVEQGTVRGVEKIAMTYKHRTHTSLAKFPEEGFPNVCKIISALLTIAILIFGLFVASGFGAVIMVLICFESDNKE